MSFQSMEFHGVKCVRWAPDWAWRLSDESQRDKLEASLFRSGDEEDIRYYDVNFALTPQSITQ